MTIVRDDYHKDTKKLVVMASSNLAELYASQCVDGDFYVCMNDTDLENVQGWYFDKEACHDAVKFFQRLIEIMEKSK